MAAKKDTSAAVPAGSDKKKALETAMQQIEKMYGKGSIMRYGENAETNVEAIPTGLPGPGPGSGHRRRAPGPHHRDLRTGVLR